MTPLCFICTPISDHILSDYSSDAICHTAIEGTGILLGSFNPTHQHPPVTLWANIIKQVASLLEQPSYKAFISFFPPTAHRQWVPQQIHLLCEPRARWEPQNSGAVCGDGQRSVWGQEWCWVRAAGLTSHLFFSFAQWDDSEARLSSSLQCCTLHGLQ